MQGFIPIFDTKRSLLSTRTLIWSFRLIIEVIDHLRKLTVVVRKGYIRELSWMKASCDNVQVELGMILSAISLIYDVIAHAYLSHSKISHLGFLCELPFPLLFPMDFQHYSLQVQ